MEHGIPFTVMMKGAEMAPSTPWEEIVIHEAVIAVAAQAIEDSKVFRTHYSPGWDKSIHPDAVRLATIALSAAARHQRSQEKD